jgi:hypothetical protein
VDDSEYCYSVACFFASNDFYDGVLSGYFIFSGTVPVIPNDINSIGNTKHLNTDYY